MKKSDIKYKIAEAHMAGQSDAGCKHASWGEAYAYATKIIDQAMPEPKIVMAVSDNQKKVLEYFYERYADERVYFYDGIAKDLKMPVAKVRLYTRALKRKGLVSFCQAFNEWEGQYCGSGHFCSNAGAELMKSLEDGN